MFIEQFTERARSTIVSARQIVLGLGHNNLRTEHLLLSLLDKTNGTAVKILKELGLDDIESLKNYLISKIPSGDSTDPNRDIPFASGSRKALEASIEEANSSSHVKVGTGHMLLGLIKTSEGVVYNLFDELQIDLEEAREAFISVAMSGYQNTVSNVETPALNKFTHDITQRARDGKLDPVIGRNKETERLIQVLCRRTKNNPVLIGEPGVGKTAIVEGLAQKIINNTIPNQLKNKRILSLDLGLLVAGTKYRGQFEERITMILEELKKVPNILLFVDELHTLVGAGAAEGSLDASNILKPSLARGELRCIGATTLNEYKKYIEPSGALERRFQPIIVEPTNVENTIEILNGLKEKYEKYHGIKFDDEAIQQAVYLSDNYISDRHLPDKAIDVIDEAACYTKLKHVPIDAAPKHFKTIEEMRNRRKIVRAAKGSSDIVVTVDDIAHVITTWTGIPVSKMNELEISKIRDIETELSNVVIGQTDAVRTISNVVKRSKMGIKNKEKPIGSFIFVGPSGVGKTELGKCLAKYMFGRRDALIQIDMSEYNEKFSVSRLIGAPPGYVGYDEGGQLTEAIRRKPHSIIIVDELEKAHPEVINIFLQILEYGHITDGRGRKINFKNTIIIMTSNIGKSISEEKVTGFKMGEEILRDHKQRVTEEMKRILPVEFLNRVDSVVVFNNLSKDDIYKIIDLRILDLNENLKSKNMEISVEPEAKDWLLKNGFSEEYGARFLNRCIDEHVVNKISDGLVKGLLKEGDSICLVCNSDIPEVLALEESLV